MAARLSRPGTLRRRRWMPVLAAACVAVSLAMPFGVAVGVRPGSAPERASASAATLSVNLTVDPPIAALGPRSPGRPQ